jgi:hypothetical protein
MNIDDHKKRKEDEKSIISDQRFNFITGVIDEVVTHPETSRTIDKNGYTTIIRPSSFSSDMVGKKQEVSRTDYGSFSSTISTMMTNTGDLHTFAGLEITLPDLTNIRTKDQTSERIKTPPTRSERQNYAGCMRVADYE